MTGAALAVPDILRLCALRSAPGQSSALWPLARPLPEYFSHKHGAGVSGGAPLTGGFCETKTLLAIGPRTVPAKRFCVAKTQLATRLSGGKLTSFA